MVNGLIQIDCRAICYIDFRSRFNVCVSHMRQTSLISFSFSSEGSLLSKQNVAWVENYTGIITSY